MIKTVSMIQGTTNSGKTRKLFRLFRSSVKRSKSCLIYFNENELSLIPEEEIEALASTLRIEKNNLTPEQFVDDLNTFIDEHNFEKIFIDDLHYFASNIDDVKKLNHLINYVKVDCTYTMPIHKSRKD